MWGECARNNPLMSKAAPPPGSQGSCWKGLRIEVLPAFFFFSFPPSSSSKGWLVGDSLPFHCFLQARCLLCHRFHDVCLENTALCCSAAALEDVSGWSCEIHPPCESLYAGDLGDVLGERAPKYSELMAGSSPMQDKRQLVIAVDFWGDFLRRSHLVVINAWSLRPCCKGKATLGLGDVEPAAGVGELGRHSPGLERNRRAPK